MTCVDDAILRLYAMVVELQLNYMLSRTIPTAVFSPLALAALCWWTYAH